MLCGYSMNVFYSKKMLQTPLTTEDKYKTHVQITKLTLKSTLNYSNTGGVSAQWKIQTKFNGIS